MCSLMYMTISATWSGPYPSLTSARGIVWLTIDMVPPPTSFLVLTRPRSGSTPVVSQSMSRPMVLWLTKPFATYVTLSGTDTS